MPNKTKVSVVKDWVILIREAAIIIVVMVVVIFPGVFAWWAKSVNEKGKQAGAKTTEVNIGGVKIAFDNTAKQVDNLEAAIAANNANKKEAQQLANTADSPQKAERAKKVLQNTEAVSSKLQESVSSAKNALLAQDQIIQDQIIQDAPGQSNGSGIYGIVVSADKQDDLAAYEVQQLKKLGHADVEVYSRQGFLRTVSRFPDKQAAEEKLPQIQTYRKTAYIINLGKWCPRQQDSGKKISGATVFECQ